MMKMKSCVIVMVIMALLMVEVSMAFQCGRQARGARCANRMCCSQYGYCGTTAKYCGRGCQSQCKRAEATDDEQADQVHPFSTDVPYSRPENPTDAHAAGAEAGAP